MKRKIPVALGIVMSLLPVALFSQNLPPIAVNDTVYMCGSTVTIYVQNNDTNPDGDSLTLSIYSGSINGSFTINGNAVDYTPNVGYTGVDTLVYVLCDDGVPPLCDTAMIIIHINADYFMNASANICNGDSIFLEGAWQTQPGTYIDWYTTIYGCDSVVATDLIVNPLPVANITASGSLNFCTGDSVVLSASPGTSWSWSTGDTTQSITVYNAGSYSVIVSDTNGCSDASAVVNVTTTPAPVATVSPAGPLSFCEGDSAVLSASAGSSWQWSNGETTQSITVDTTGNYWVIVSNGTCSDTSNTVSVQVFPQPSAFITANGPINFCQGDSVTLTASNGTSWNWSNGATSQSITVGASGSYWVIVSNSNGCSDTSATTTVTVNPSVAVTISPAGPISFCAGDSAVLTANGGSTWLWSNGATTQTITVYDPGSYWVIATNGSCGDTSNTVSVQVVPQPNAMISASGPTTFCQGGSITLTATNGASWLWSTGATTQSIVVSASGNYSVIVSNSSGCSDTSSSTTVTVNPSPVVFVIAGGPTTFCDGDSVQLTASNGAMWQWSNGSTSQNITVTDPGAYSVTVTDGNGCSATSSSTIVTVNSAPQAGITANGPTDLCQGQTVTLTAVNGTSWLWSTGETTQSIVVSSAGSYTVICSETCGSDTSSAVTVTVTSGPPSAGINAAASGYTYTFTDNSTGATSWNWNFGDNTSSTEENPVHLYGGPGIYMVTLIVSNACGSDTTSMLLDIGDPTKEGLFNAFSPNGDGHNDTWNVPVLNYYGDNTVTIVNRWGNEVWKASNYDNNDVVWNGQNLEGQNLPDGTYYYIITYGEKELRGWVFVKR